MNIKKYSFLFKPLFYIVNILVAAWLVIKIEQFHPSHLGKYKMLFEDKKNYSKQNIVMENDSIKSNIKKLFQDYKSAKVDSLQLEQELDKLINSVRKKDRK